MSALRAATLVFASLLVAAPASAQQYLVRGSAAVLSGAEGGGRGGLSGIQRARTAIRIGADLRVDESPKDVFGAAVLAELEPRAALGADVRYGRMVGTHLIVHVAAVAFFAPETMLGAGAGFDYRVPVSSGMAFTVGAAARFFALGTDLPDDTVVWHALFVAGFHVDL